MNVVFEKSWLRHVREEAFGGRDFSVQTTVRKAESPDKTNDSEVTFEVAMAIKNPKDKNFSRKTGRENLRTLAVVNLNDMLLAKNKDFKKMLEENEEEALMAMNRFVSDKIVNAFINESYHTENSLFMNLYISKALSQLELVVKALLVSVR